MGKLTKQRQFDLKFGKIIEISKAKSKGKRKFGEKREEEVSSRALGLEGGKGPAWSCTLYLGRSHTCYPTPCVPPTAHPPPQARACSSFCGFQHE